MPNMYTEIVFDLAEVNENVERLINARKGFFDAVRVLDKWYLGDMINVQLIGNNPEKRNTDEEVTVKYRTEIVINAAEVNEKVDKLLKAKDEFMDAAKALDKLYVGDAVSVRIIDKKDETVSGN